MSSFHSDPRSKYLATLGVPVNTKQQLHQTLGLVNGKNVVNHAIERCKKRAASQKQADFYNSWSCHVPTISNVLDEVEKVVKELDLPSDWEAKLRKEIKDVYDEHSVDSPTIIG